MNVRDLLGFVLVPLVLFIVAVALRGFGFASPSGYGGIGELGMLVAISLLIVGGTSLVYQLPPGQLPVAGVLLVTITCIVVASAEVIFYALGLDPQLRPDDLFGRHWGGDYPYVAALRTLMQFTLILMVLFAVPRLAKRRNGP